MKVKSKLLVGELKSFIANGSSYAAKIGETDDLVMSTLLAVRMASEIKNYIPELDEFMRDREDDIQPLPFVIM